MKSRTFLLLLALLVLLPPIGAAQGVPQQLGIWRFDSSFYIGASDIPDARKAVDAYHMRFVQDYAQDLPALRSLIGATYDTTGNWGGDAGRYKAWIVQQFYRDCDVSGLKLIAALGGLEFLVYANAVSEHYYNTPPYVQNADFRAPRTTTWPYGMVPVGTVAKFNKGDLFTGTTVPANGGDSVVYIAGDPR